MGATPKKEATIAQVASSDSAGSPTSGAVALRRSPAHLSGTVAGGAGRPASSAARNAVTPLIPPRYGREARDSVLPAHPGCPPPHASPSRRRRRAQGYSR
ncbi:hypothetical protein GCM10027406_23480 [Leifsonia lichenia]